MGQISICKSVAHIWATYIYYTQTSATYIAMAHAHGPYTYLWPIYRTYLEAIQIYIYTHIYKDYLQDMCMARIHMEI